MIKKRYCKNKQTLNWISYFKTLFLYTAKDYI